MRFGAEVCVRTITWSPPTVTLTVPDPPTPSVTEIFVVPFPTGVTLNVAVCPWTSSSATVATVGSAGVAENERVEGSAAVKFCGSEPALENESDVVDRLRMPDGVGVGVGGEVGVGVGVNDGFGVGETPAAGCD